MGDVYLAEDKRLQRTVAIKKIKNELIANIDNTQARANNKKAIDNALNEARLLARLNHPNIVQIYDIIPEPQQISLVMEYLSGKTLQYYQKENILSLAQKISILSQISRALAAAHSEGIVHCDLKSANIIIDIDAVVKIVDFGIAKLTNSNSQVTNNSQSFGSQTAMSPEQLQNILIFSNDDNEIKDIDFRSDLFSLGIIAFQLITGHHPFAGNSALITAQNILSGNQEKQFSPEDIVPKLPNELIYLLNKLLAFKPEDRPSSTQWVQRQFDQISQHLHQQDVSNEDTLPLNASTAEKLTLHASNSASLQANKITLSKRTKTTLVSVIILIAVCFGVLSNNVSLFDENAPSTRYVVVLPPVLINAKPLAEMQKNLITATIEDSIRQSIINTKGLLLIPKSEVDSIAKEVNSSLTKIGEATSASDIITTELDCNNVSCNITLSRLESPYKNEKNRKWIVSSQKKWPTELENITIKQSAQVNLKEMYPKYNESYLTEQPVKQQDYLYYIELYNLLSIQGKNSDENLDKLANIITKSPYLYPAYTLYRNSALSLYDETLNEEYIRQFESIISGAPPEYKYSIFQLMDSFYIALALKNYDDVQKNIDKLSALDVDEITLLKLKGALYIAQNNLGDAIKSYKTALVLRPSIDLLYNLSITYFELSQYDNAKKTLKRLLNVIPNIYDAKLLLADTYLLKGDIKSAITHYESIQKYAGRHSHLDNLSIAYSLVGHYDKAHQAAELALSVQPNNPVTILNLADITYILGHSEQANYLYQQIIELTKSNNQLYSLLLNTQAHVHLGNNSEAIIALTKAKRISPDNGEVAFISALVYSQLNEKTSAVNQVEEALATNIGSVWFRLPWFDPLCDNSTFRKIMIESGEVNRCL